MFKVRVKTSDKIVTVFSVLRKPDTECTQFLLYNDKQRKWEWVGANYFEPLEENQ